MNALILIFCQQIVLTNESGQTRMFFAEINTNNISDIQSRVSEALIVVIDKLDGVFPKNNYVVKIRHDDNMHIGKIVFDFKPLTF